MSPRSAAKTVTEGDRVYEIDRGPGNRLGDVYLVGRVMGVENGQKQIRRHPRRRVPPHVAHQILSRAAKKIRKRRELPSSPDTDVPKARAEPESRFWVVRFLAALRKAGRIEPDASLLERIRTAKRWADHPVTGEAA